jgi:hypothetical protein
MVPGMWIHYELWQYGNREDRGPRQAKLSKILDFYAFREMAISFPIGYLIAIEALRSLAPSYL